MCGYAMACHVEVRIQLLESSQSSFVCGFWEFKLSILVVFVFMLNHLAGPIFCLSFLSTFYLVFFEAESVSTAVPGPELVIICLCLLSARITGLNHLAGRIILILNCWDIFVDCVKVAFVLFKFWFQYLAGQDFSIVIFMKHHLSRCFVNILFHFLIGLIKSWLANS